MARTWPCRHSRFQPPARGRWHRAMRRCTPSAAELFSCATPLCRDDRKSEPDLHPIQYDERLIAYDVVVALEPLPRERAVILHASRGDDEDDVARAGDLIALLNLRQFHHVALELSDVLARAWARDHRQQHDAGDEH